MNRWNKMLVWVSVGVIATTMTFSIMTNLYIKKKLPNDIQEQIQLFFVREKLVDHLKVYNVFDEEGPLNFVRHGKENDGGYVLPVKALEKSDVLLGYGIDNDNSFEDNFSLQYNKPSYGFDCGIDHIDGKSPLFTFVRECIASDATLYNRSKIFNRTNTNGMVGSFEQHVTKLKVADKKMFVKMDIEGAEYDAMPGVLKHSKNIMGLCLEIHILDVESAKKALRLLKNLEKDFILVHVHGTNSCFGKHFSTNNSQGKVSHLLELSYINKSLVNRFELSDNQAHPTALDQPVNADKPEVVFEVMD